MGLPAGILNRRVVLLQRVPMPSAAGEIRGGFTPSGSAIWGGYRPRGTEEFAIGGLLLRRDMGVLTLRHDRGTEQIRESDRAEFDSKTWEIVGRQVTEKPDGALRFDVRTVATRSTYASEVDAKGEAAVIRRAGQTTGGILVRALIRGFQPEEITGGIQAGERRAIVLAEDVEKAGWTDPPKAGDRVIIRATGKNLGILSVDDSTHRVAGVLNAYEMRLQGG